MATINIDINGLQVSFSLSDQDAGRILTAHTAFYTEGNNPPPAPQQVVERLAQEVVTGLAQRTLAWEQDEAAAAARLAVPAIPATVQP